MVQDTVTAGDSPGGQFLGRRFISAMRDAAGAQPIGGPSHLAHLLRVSGLVLEDGGAEDEVIAALLHDADGEQAGEPARLRGIRQRYGDGVAEIVSVCTDSFNDPKPSWRARKIDHLQQIEDASPGAVRVSLADNLDHVRGLVANRLLADPRGGWYGAGGAEIDAGAHYASIARAFARRQPSARTDELGRLAHELEELSADQSSGEGIRPRPDQAVEHEPQTRPAKGGGRTRGQAATIPMTNVGIRELAANVSAVIADVAKSGRPAVVTKHGEPVAALIPIADLQDLLLARALRDSEAVIASAVEPTADDVSRTQAPQ
jgi:prevent-host-death family protein